MNSTSGDDRALENNALDWMNAHLVDVDIKLDALFGGSLADGVALIQALEHATGESVGKYRKSATMQVHKVDNISVALGFLSKRGIATSFLNPQGWFPRANWVDIFNDDRGKILSLFNLILKKQEWKA